MSYGDDVWLRMLPIGVHVSGICGVVGGLGMHKLHPAISATSQEAWLTTVGMPSTASIVAALIQAIHVSLLTH